MEDIQIWFQHPLVKGAITGFITAAGVDYAAFRSWKSYNDLLQYDWPTAFWRWGQGLISGLVVAAGFWAAA